MLKIITFFFVYLFAWNASAQESNRDVARLGKDLTPVGAERKGNGSDIPSWTGGLQQSKSHEPGSFHTNPYFRDKPLFTINSKNLEQYKDRLSFGSQQLLKKFPSMEMPVYKTHRSASYPDYVYEGIKNNVNNASLMKYGSGVENSRISSPFPIPESGLEVLWNHTLRFRGQALQYIASTVHINSAGSRSVTIRDNKYYFAYSDPELSLSLIHIGRGCRR